MESRRAFLKKASLLAGATAAFQLLPSSIARALAIQAAEGTTYLDAEHIVFLMQENRSFDHCYGTLQGVRGFNDPRAIIQEDGLPIWIQKNAENKAYAPFRLDIENTNATWMGSLPHSWKDMVAARNNGKLDTWLEAKKADNRTYQHMPLTMGYHNRQDIPFYYAFADAFTICDQHFCSSLTGTSANRSYFWAGAIRENPHDPESVAHVDNGQINYKDVNWTTYPERLEEAGISWRVYQNELSVPVGFEGEEEDWLANFTNNNLEFYRQYQVRYHPAHHRWIQKTVDDLRQQISQERNTTGETYRSLQAKLQRLESELNTYSEENFNKLDDFTKKIHQKAFATNTEDPDYHRLASLTYQDKEGEKTVQVPKGDIFHQFRQDVYADRLPTVSWLVAPCRFSDHPGSPWFGAWYVSETLDILTKNPEIWKKTIFILTYDENDGYFDHIAPFVPAHSDRPFSGLNPEGMDTRTEYVTRDQERIRTNNPDAVLDSPIGLGFRVPMVVASPWSKGGWVNSEVMDLTSNLQFLEHFIEKKFGKDVRETNLSAWRRMVCGDLTSVFQPAGSSERIPSVELVNRNQEVARIYTARDQGLPGNFVALQLEELEAVRRGEQLEQMPIQEKGTKRACALPYDIEVNATVDTNTNELVLHFLFHGRLLTSKKEMAVPLIVRALAPYRYHEAHTGTWNFTVKSQEPMTYRWPLSRFVDGRYRLDVHGPNGFFRSFCGDVNEDSGIAAEVSLQLGQQVLDVKLIGLEKGWQIRDLSYGNKVHIKKTAGTGRYVVDCTETNGWYDLSFTADGGLFYRYAGHIDVGRPSRTDPLMGGEIQMP
ncbi:phosphocholine-specific phospholipase C [Sphingobacterium olei]|nr:phospholipase C, phosphocholine-specific [Sphingobacterium olei]